MPLFTNETKKNVFFFYCSSGLRAPVLWCQRSSPQPAKVASKRWQPFPQKEKQQQQTRLPFQSPQKAATRLQLVTEPTNILVLDNVSLCPETQGSLGYQWEHPNDDYISRQSGVYGTNGRLLAVSSVSSTIYGAP